jgi:hypothetical protein
MLKTLKIHNFCYWVWIGSYFWQPVDDAKFQMDFVFIFYKCVYVTFHAWLKVIASVQAACISSSIHDFAWSRSDLHQATTRGHIHTERRYIAEYCMLSKHGARVDIKKV